MFGVSFGEILLVGVVALLVAVPRRLPELLGTLGRWIAKFRNMTTEMRRQTGIDDILRQEGLSGGLQELRSMMRGELTNPLQVRQRAGAAARPQPAPDAVVDAYGEALDFDRYREFPVEGVDSYGAISEDLADLAAASLAAPPAAQGGGGTLLATTANAAPKDGGEPKDAS